MLRGDDYRIPWMPATGNFGLDLVDQDHRVADDHANERDEPEDSDKAHWGAREKQGGGDANDSEWSSGDYQEEPLETLQLQHQDRNHQEQHEGKDRQHTRLRLGTLLHGPARHDVVASGEFRLERGNLGGERFHDGCRLYAWNGIGLDGDG